jgi:hypothetical protein
MPSAAERFYDRVGMTMTFLVGIQNGAGAKAFKPREFKSQSQQNSGKS